MKRNITDRLAKSLKPEGDKRVEIIDASTPGLRFRVNGDGSKSWSLLASGPSGKKFRVTLGDYPGLSVADARTEAGEMKKKIRAGFDPAQAKQEAKAAAQAEDTAVTLKQALDLYDAAHLSTLRTGYATKRDLERDFSKLMEQKAHTITPKQIADVIDTKAKKSPIMARRLHAYGRAWFKWLSARQHIEGNPFEKLTAPGAEKARERVLTHEEVGAIWNALPGLGEPFNHCIRVLLLTGQRREEVAGMRRDELDLEGMTWTVPAARSKTGRALRVPLPEKAVEEIKAALVSSDKAEKEEKNKKAAKKQPRKSALVFSTTGDTPISGFSRAKKRLDEAVQALMDKRAKKAGETPSPVPGWRLHDFRRTMVSAMADMGIDATVADRCLNHKAAATMSTVQRVYQQSDMFEQRKHATNAWAAKVLEWSDDKQAGNVVPYRRDAK